MAVIIGSARIDERGKLTGGSVGDQKQKSSSNDTVGEVSMQNFYVHSKGWYILRPKDTTIANKIAANMKTACNNVNIGYDQGNRFGIINYGVNTKTKTECDCTTLVRECVKEASGKDPGNFTTANEASVLESSGLFEKKKSYTTGTTLYTGDVLVTKTKGHTVIVVEGKQRNSTVSTTTPNNSASNSLIKTGLLHAKNFTGVDDSNNVIKAKGRVLQRAMNLDYGKTIDEDASIGPKSKSKLGSHYVKKGERQYMVTAAEILMYLNNIDPNGVELPGHYGNGLVNAAKKKFGGNGQKITASNFLTLVK